MANEFSEMMLCSPKTTSVYGLFATYLKSAIKVDNYVRGHIDDENVFLQFLEEFSFVCKTKFTTRTSWKKNHETRAKGRYGREERLYWEYKSGNLMVPFTGVPFVVRSCLTKHCQFGQHYYKTTGQRFQKQLEASQTDPSLAPPQTKKRRNKLSKKRNCPAILHIREIVLFPDFALPLNSSTKGHRTLKATRLGELRQALNSNQQVIKPENGQLVHRDPFNRVHRFFLNLPLPEAHRSHLEPCGGFASKLSDSTVNQIDDLVKRGIYKASHVHAVLRRSVEQELISRYGEEPNESKLEKLCPSEDVIAEHIYINSITCKPTVIVEEEEEETVYVNCNENLVDSNVPTTEDDINTNVFHHHHPSISLLPKDTNNSQLLNLVPNTYNKFSFMLNNYTDGDLLESGDVLYMDKLSSSDSVKTIEYLTDSSSTTLEIAGNQATSADDKLYLNLCC